MFNAQFYALVAKCSIKNWVLLKQVKTANVITVQGISFPSHVRGRLHTILYINIYVPSIITEYKNRSFCHKVLP